MSPAAPTVPLPPGIAPDPEGPERVVLLDDDGAPWYDRQMAARLAARGMDIAAMTPDRFADWLAEVTQ